MNRTGRRVISPVFSALHDPHFAEYTEKVNIRLKINDGQTQNSKYKNHKKIRLKLYSKIEGSISKPVFTLGNQFVLFTHHAIVVLTVRL